MKPVLTAGLAFAAFAALHSLTVSDRFKRLVQRLVGERRMRAWYRLAFTVFSAVITVLFVIVYLQQPDRFLHRPPGYILWPAHALQLAGVFLLAAAARPFDFGFFTGVRQAREYLRTGRTGGDIEGLSPSGLVSTGAYGLVRHPMYLGGIMMLAFEPNLSVNCLVVRALAVLYFVYGGVMEERRLLNEFGEEYRAYKKRVPMFNVASGMMRRFRSLL